MIDGCHTTSTSATCLSGTELAGGLRVDVERLELVDVLSLGGDRAQGHRNQIIVLTKLGHFQTAEKRLQRDGHVPAADPGSLRPRLVDPHDQFLGLRAPVVVDQLGAGNLAQLVLDPLDDLEQPVGVATGETHLDRRPRRWPERQRSDAGLKLGEVAGAELLERRDDFVDDLAIGGVEQEVGVLGAERLGVVGQQIARSALAQENPPVGHTARAVGPDQHFPAHVVLDRIDDPFGTRQRRLQRQLQLGGKGRSLVGWKEDHRDEAEGVDPRGEGPDDRRDGQKTMTQPGEQQLAVQHVEPRLEAGTL